MGDFAIEQRVQFLELCILGQYSSGEESRCQPTHIIIMIPMYIMRQLMAQHPANIRVQPEPIVPICPYPQLDLLAPVHIQAEEIRVLVRRELGEQANSEAMPLHDVPDGGVVGEALEEGARGVRAGEGGEGGNLVEAVGEVGG